jgi:hypothetical protein
MKTLIIPDIHGHYETLKGLLREAGVLDHQNHRVDGWRVIQLGDLANCVSENVRGDLACLKTVGDWIDEMLPGNHELPYFMPEGQRYSLGSFGGYHYYPDVAMQLNRIEREGYLVPAALVGDVLVTHAGYVPSEGIESAQDGFDYAVKKWSEDKKHPLFTQVGRSRYGNARFGGILWSDWSEQKAHEFNQIVGHTPQSKGVQRRDYATGNWSLCIDCGAKSGKGATGVVFDEDGEMSFVETSMSGNHAF